MKMNPETFKALEADCVAVCGALDIEPASIATGADAWAVLHRVNRDRSYGDDHPGFSGGHWTRVLPRTMEEGTHYMDIFYNAGLVDAHIKTALSVIFPNAAFKDRYAY